MCNKILCALVFAVGCNWLGVADAAYVIKLKNGKLPASAPGLSCYHVIVRNGDENCQGSETRGQFGIM